MRIGDATLTILLVLSGSTAARAQPVPDDAPEVLSDLAAACRGDDARACYDLGVRYQVGEEVAQDFAVAMALFRYACDHDDSYGCNGVARLYERGDGVRASPRRAVQHFERACALEDWPVCYYLGWMHVNGHLVRRDLDEARRRYRQACDHGYADACAALELPPMVTDAQLEARLSRFLLDAAEAALRATRGETVDPGYLGTDAARDLRASSRANAPPASARLDAVAWLFEWRERVPEPGYHALQVLVIAFADGRVRWTYRAEERGGRPSVAELTDIDHAAPHLRFPMRRALDRMLGGRCRDLTAARPADARGLPAPIRDDVASGHRGFDQSCRMMRGLGDLWLPYSSFIVGVTTDASGAAVGVRTNVVVLDGRTFLRPAEVFTF